MASVGAFAALEDNGFTDDLELFGGASAGSGLAALLACGHTAKECKDIEDSTDFAQFLDGGRISRQLWNLYWYNGMNPGTYMRNFFDQKIEAKIGCKNATFAQMHAKTKKELVIVATSYKTHKRFVYSIDNTPDTPIADAIRASSALPIVFTPFPGPVDESGEPDIQVDGGVCDNFPMDLSDDVRKDGAHHLDPFALGIDLIVPEPDLSWASVKKDGLIAYITGIVNTSIDQVTTLRLRQGVGAADKRRKIQVPIHGIGTADFKLTQAQKNLLYSSGYTAGTNFITE